MCILASCQAWKQNGLSAVGKARVCVAIKGFSEGRNVNCSPFETCDSALSPKIELLWRLCPCLAILILMHTDDNIQVKVDLMAGSKLSSCKMHFVYTARYRVTLHVTAWRCSKAITPDTGAVISPKEQAITFFCRVQLTGHSGVALPK